MYSTILEYRLYGVIQDVVFTHQPHFSCSFLSLICLSTNQNRQLILSLLIRIEWTTGNGIFMSSSHWPIYNKLYPGLNRFLNVKALISAYYQEKALVGASSVIVKIREPSFPALLCWYVAVPLTEARRRKIALESDDSRRASSRGLIPKAKVKTIKMTFVIVFGECCPVSSYSWCVVLDANLSQYSQNRGISCMPGPVVRYLQQTWITNKDTSPL